MSGSSHCDPRSGQGFSALPAAQPGPVLIYSPSAGPVKFGMLVVYSTGKMKRRLSVFSETYLVLTSFVLHRDSDSSRHMSETYCRFGFVHVLRMYPLSYISAQGND